jgi:L-threonine kinase
VGAALRALVARRQLPATGEARLRSTVPPGKGLGSSTADVGAALFALAAAHGITLASEEAARIALTVEPTDGSLFPGIVAFDHREGRWFEALGDPPPVVIVLLDPGGTVDTVAYNAVDRSAVLRRNEPRTREALAMARAAMRAGDVALLGAAATLSAMTHQPVLPKPLLGPAIAAAREVGAAGVCVAHSGTAVGILLDARRADAEAARAWVTRRLACPARLVRLVSGGPRFSRREVATRSLLPVS